MSFGGLFDAGDLPYGSSAMRQGGGRFLPSPLLKPTFSSTPGLSLGLQANMEGRGDINRLAVIGGDDVRSKDEENESRSGSDNVDGVSGDDLEQENPRKKKRYHRHTPQQIQELESLFKECPHPDEKQRMELSKRLSLESRQVKFWFQNRRTQMKTQIERHENSILRQENDKLRAENMTIREAMRNPICNNCGSPAMLGEVSLEEQHLRIENARLKDDLDRVSNLAGKFLSRPMSSMTSPIPRSSLDLALVNNGGFAGMSTVAPTLSVVSDFAPSPMRSSTPARTMGGMENTAYLDLALNAMDELMKMVRVGEPLWIFEGGKEVLNNEEYHELFPPCIGMKPVGYETEATRETGTVIINSLALVETLMDNRWSDMFPCMVARTMTNEVLLSGVGGSRSGALQLMHAELQIISPLVPIRDVNFIRFCKQHAENVWAVVDVSIDGNRENAPSMKDGSHMSCRRLPSGCVVQDMPNGYSKVTWVEHSEYDENAVHQMYRKLLRSGMGLGAQRWLATLRRQCECLAILMSTSVPTRDHTVTGVTAEGRGSMLKLAQRMTENFCTGVCASSTQHKWTALRGENLEENVRVLTRQSLKHPGEPPGVVLSAATSVWLPVNPQRLFDFLRDETLRCQWDILSNGGPMLEMAHIAKGQDHGNAVSLLRAGADQQQGSMLILQETCTDASGSLVVYAPVDVPAMHVVMTGGDSACVALLPSGFAIAPDGPNPGGSLLTVAFQILVNNPQPAKLTDDSVKTVNTLISCTIKKIKAALHCDN